MPHIAKLMQVVEHLVGRAAVERKK